MLQKNDLFLDSAFIESGDIKDIKIIKKAHTDGMIKIAEVHWDPADKSCYIKTIRDNLQNNIIDYEEFLDFIYLVDEAYYELESIYNR